MLQTDVVWKQAAWRKIAPAKRSRNHHDVRHQDQRQEKKKQRVRNHFSNYYLLFGSHPFHIFAFPAINLRFIQDRNPTRMKSRVAIALASPKFVPESRKAMLYV